MATAKSRQAYAISMRDTYHPALVIEIFYHRGSTLLPSQQGHVWHKRGWYWRDTDNGAWAGPFDTAEAADDDYFTI